MKYKIGDNVILNDDVEFWFKKVGGCEVSIVDTTSCSYKIKIGENQYVFIDDNSINHKATSELKNKFRYKVGDKVKIKDTLNKENIFSLANQILEIEFVDTDDKYLPYRVSHEGFTYWVGDDEIDHEATAKLNSKAQNDDSISSVSSIEISSIDASSYIKEINFKGGETMNANEILEKWKSKRMCEIETECKNKKDQLTKEDEIVKLVDKHIAQMNKTIKEKYDGVEKAVQVAVIRTPETEEKINLAEEEMSDKKLNIKKKIEEIKAVLEVAENQDKVFEILNKQGIIDKNYNIL